MIIKLTSYHDYHDYQPNRGRRTEISRFAAVELSKIIVRAPTKSAVPSDRDTKPLANSVTDRFAIVGEVAHISA